VQISRIYSNRDAVFAPIDFNSGSRADRLNVVYGEVHRPKDEKKDSHNLGKTTLIHLIDFLMLKGMSPDQFLIKHQERFKDFVFFLEILLPTGGYATIRRSASDPNKIALARHDEPSQDFVSKPDDHWDHFDMPREDAVKLMDGWLDIKLLKPYDYRQAITYFLRSQADYSDELQLQKFSVGSHRHWKPFVAHLFGLNDAPIQRKYELDEEVEDLKRKQAEQQTTVQYSEDQLPELTAKIGVLHRQVNEIEASLDAFRFDDEERRIVRELVDEIEEEIAETNDRLYNVRYDMRQIDTALEHKDRFDLSEVEEIFTDAGINFPGALKKQYEELVSFNKKVTHERNTALRARRKELAAEEARLLEAKARLDSKRESELRIIRSTDTFEKFKELQKDLSRQRGQLVYMEEQRLKLELVAETAKQVRESERDRGRVIDEIKTMVARPTVICERFTSIFNSYCQRVLNHDGIFYFFVNSSNNFDYTIGLSLVGQAGKTSSLSAGNTYRKLLCVLFDLALLKVYEAMPFFHFVYHDGVFEALDDRKKLALLGVVRDQVASGQLQYILTLIDSDLPRDAEQKRLEFGEDEIVLHLHDDGDDGRLFKMPEF
jgi:uncharacterized protein YydD (DUF2326 family)